MSQSFCILDENGVILQEEASDLPYPLYSITKTIIGALILDLKLDVERPLSDWLGPDWVPRGKDIMLHHLLTHTSGLCDYGALLSYQEAVAAGEKAWSDRQFADQTLVKPLPIEPGQGWSYSNPGFWALKRVCEVESGTSFADLVADLISGAFAAPSLQVTSGIFSDRLPSYEAGWVWHGLVCGTAKDTARFMHASPIAQLAKRTVPVPNAGPTYPRAAYGLGVMTDLDGVSYGHNGSGPGFSTSCFHFARTGITICCLMAYEGPDDAAYAEVQRLARQFEAL